MTKAKLKSVAALVFGVSIALVAWDGAVTRTAEVEGYVLTASDSRDAALVPVVGALVSTSLNSVTGVTDQNGHFHLRTGVRVSGDEFYIVTVQSGDMLLRRRTVSPNMRRQQFVLAKSPRR
jgi:hypothetical protein